MPKVKYTTWYEGNKNELIKGKLKLAENTFEEKCLTEYVYVTQFTKSKF